MTTDGFLDAVTCLDLTSARLYHSHFPRSRLLMGERLSKWLVEMNARLQSQQRGTGGCSALYLSAVEERRVLDVRDLSEIPDRSFDATVAFGGPILYAFEQAERALSECLRVTQIGGVVLASVMATIGTMRFFLSVVVEESRQYGMEVTDAVLRTGDLRHTPADAHRCRMFRWREILAMIDALPCRLLAASASDATSLGDAAGLEWFAGEPGRWRRYLDWEEELAQEPGALDGGTHILFAVEPLDGAERGGDAVVSAPEASELPPGGTGG